MPSLEEPEDRAENVTFSSDGELLSARFCLDCGTLNSLDAPICRRCGSLLAQEEIPDEDLPVVADWRYRLSEWVSAPIWRHLRRGLVYLALGLFFYYGLARPVFFPSIPAATSTPPRSPLAVSTATLTTVQYLMLATSRAHMQTATFVAQVPTAISQPATPTAQVSAATITPMIPTLTPTALLPPATPVVKRGFPAIVSTSTGQVITVDTIAEISDGLCHDEGCSLSEAVALAENGATIKFIDGLKGELHVPSLSVDKKLTIIGPASDEFVLSTIDDSHYGVFIVKPGADLSIIGVTFAFARTGAIINQGGKLTLWNCIFSDNFGTFGAALDNENGSVTVIMGSLFRRNIASEGGAIYNLGGRLTIRDSVFADVTALTRGGGISNQGGDVLVVNTTFERIPGNLSSVIYNAAAGTTNLLSTIIRTFDSKGAAILVNAAGQVKMANTTIVAGTPQQSCEGTILDLGGNRQFPGAACGMTIPTVDPGPDIIQYNFPDTHLLASAARVSGIAAALVGIHNLGNADVRSTNYLYFDPDHLPHCDIIYQGQTYQVVFTGQLWIGPDIPISQITALVETSLSLDVNPSEKSHLYNIQRRLVDGKVISTCPHAIVIQVSEAYGGQTLYYPVEIRDWEK